MKFLQSLLLAISFSIIVSAQPSMDEFFPIDAGHSYLEFSVKYMGYAKVKGHFERFSGIVRYDENDIMNTSVTIDVETSSIDTDHEWRDKDLKSANWFDAETFPKMSFTSKSVVPKEGGFDLVGELTLKDITRDITFQMDPPSGILIDTRGDLQVIFTGAAEIDRTDFHVAGERWSRIKEGITSVSNMVQIEISILGKRNQEQNLANFIGDNKRPTGQINDAYKAGGVALALQKFEELSSNPENRINVNTLNLIGHYLIARNELADAILLLERNLQSFPSNAKVYISLGEAYVRDGRIGEATNMYQKTLDLDANDVIAKEIIRHL